ncbi:MAG TPA: DNA polymerase III subunit alpha [Kiritimatiellia bacterium]|nr:DNA polymerase III subunit alpha [Kiritimatiellia bacterium]
MTETNTPFVHLHFHSEYSLLDGANRLDKACARAAELGMSALALTDHGAMYGAIEFIKKAKIAGIKPIIGCEAYMSYGRMTERRVEEGTGQKANHQVLLAENNEGYYNLVKLVSLAQLEGFYYKPRIDMELLSQNSRGLIGTTSCLKGKVTEAVVRGDMKLAMELTGQFSDIFGPDNFFIELQNHGLEEQRIANRGLIEIARKTGLKLIASNDVHYLRKEHAEAHDVMLCMQTSTVMSDPKRMRYGSDEFFMKSGAEMLALFREFPEALSNTVAIAERCHIDLKLGKTLHFPTYIVPEGYSQKQYLIKLGKIGLRDRYGVEDIDTPRNEEEIKIAERFYYELKIIEDTGFINYFLVVWDFIKFAHDSGIPVGPGRGSGAGSIIAYALGITGIDPLRYNLFFERFLNPERVSPPDFDIDFCQNRRSEVIDYVKRKYGRENVAQIITFGTLGPKTVIRDLARVLEIPLGEADKLAKMVPEDPEMTLEKALKDSPEFRQACDTNENAIRIMKHAHVLEGLARNPGTHAAGVVIGEKPLIEIVPLTRDKEKEPVTQYEMGPLGEVGLLKMDFLGLKTLTVIQEACHHISKNHGVDLDMDRIPMDDARTFELLNRGDTVGVFQVESKGMRDLLRKFVLTKFEDLIAMIALYRPGPMNMLDDFIKRRHGQVKIEYDHPLLQQTLEETFGVMVYQEQVMAATNLLAGFSLGEGDVMRRAMGKKNQDEMLAQRLKFIEGCKKNNNISKEKAGAIFDNIQRFAGYGFNKSHSAAYAIVSWQTAFQKAHYPTEFMAASLSYEIGNPDRMKLFIAECQALGIELLPPSVNESGVLFTPIKNAIRFGMAGIKNVGHAATELIVKEREANGPFKGLHDFCARLDSQALNKKTLESLVRAGAFDFTGMPRSRLFAGIEGALSRAASEQRDRAVGQFSLFGDANPISDGKTSDELPKAEPWPQNVELAAEKELLGFYISGHPLAAYQWTLEKYALANMDMMREMTEKTRTRVGGLVTQFAKKFTKTKQEAMGVFMLEQLDGVIEVVVFPAAFSDFGVYLRDEAPVLVCGEVVNEDGIKMYASEIYPLNEVHKHFAKKMNLHISAARSDENILREVRGILRSHPGDIQVGICIEQPGGEKIYVDADHTFRVSASERLVREIEKLLGEDTVYLVVNPAPCLRPPRQFNGQRRMAMRD